MAQSIEFQILADAGDGKDTRQLHNPPDENLYGQQCVARPRASHADEEYCQRDIGVEHIPAGHVLVVASYHVPLPQCTDEQDGWEDDVDQLVRYQDDTDGDDQETYEE